MITAQQGARTSPARKIVSITLTNNLGADVKGRSRTFARSPHLDHAAARDIGFRCVWIDRGDRAHAYARLLTPDATLATLASVPPLFASRSAGNRRLAFGDNDDGAYTRNLHRLTKPSRSATLHSDAVMEARRELAACFVPRGAARLSMKAVCNHFFGRRAGARRSSSS